jgi:archaellum component FlaF (FlaF/FlaG flagellin family)
VGRLWCNAGAGSIFFFTYLQMSTISKKLSGLLYNGTDLALASAPFKGNLNAVYGFNADGNGYTVFKPVSNFNSLTKLVQDGSYIVDAATTGFDLPGAVLTATSSGSSSPGTVTVVPVVKIDMLTARLDDATGYLKVLANVSGADTIKLFPDSVREVVASLAASQDTAVTTTIYYSSLTSGQLPVQLLRAGTVVLDYSFWIHD